MGGWQRLPTQNLTYAPYWLVFTIVTTIKNSAAYKQAEWDFIVPYVDEYLKNYSVIILDFRIILAVITHLGHTEIKYYLNNYMFY
jgi:hypothetical protein